MSVPLFRCGHPRTPENFARKDRPYCRTCHNERRRQEREGVTPEERHLEHRIKYLPIALERTREKLRELEQEARSYGMIELLDEPKKLTGNQILTNPEHVNRAWDREADIARIMGALSNAT